VIASSAGHGKSRNPPIPWSEDRSQTAPPAAAATAASSWAIASSVCAWAPTA